MNLTKTQQQQVLKILAMSEEQLSESMMSEHSLRDIRQKVSAIITEINPPKFFKRLA